MSGKAAGVVINASSSGVGGASKVVMRGTKSIEQSSNALYVIDGIPMYNFGGGGGTEFDSKGATEAIADINPDDIESISFLTGCGSSRNVWQQRCQRRYCSDYQAGTDRKTVGYFLKQHGIYEPICIAQVSESVWNRYTGRCGRFSHIKLGA